MKILEYIKEAVGKAKGGKYVAEQGAIKKLELEYPNYKPDEKYEPDSQAGIEPLSEKTKAFKNVCVAAEKFGLSLEKMLDALKAIKEAEADIEFFVTRANKVISDYDKFKKMLNTYNNMPFDKLNVDDIITNVEVLNGALINAHVIYREHKLNPNRYQNNKIVQALLDKIVGNEQMSRNSATGKIEPVYIGLIREFFELADKLLETVDKPPVNQSEEYNSVKQYIIRITTLNWKQN